MPLVNNSNRTYVSLDKNDHVFKIKTGQDEYQHSPVYRGFLKDVRWSESNNPKYPARFVFLFDDGEGNEEVLQSSEGSILSLTLINAFAGYENPLGQEFHIGVYTTKNDNPGYWIKDREGGSEVPQVPGKFSFDQQKQLVAERFSGDRTAFIKALYERHLRPHLDSQEEVPEFGAHEQAHNDPKMKEVVDNLVDQFDAEPVTADTNMGGVDMGNTPFDDIDDDLPF